MPAAAFPIHSEMLPAKVPHAAGGRNTPFTIRRLPRVVNIFLKLEGATHAA
jgi:hypothetical protein